MDLSRYSAFLAKNNVENSGDMIILLNDFFKETEVLESGYGNYLNLRKIIGNFEKQSSLTKEQSKLLRHGLNVW